jgi:protein-tyrosine phosphatase
VTSLLTPVEADELGLRDEPRLCADAGIRYLSFAIPDRDIPDSEIAAIDLIHNVARKIDRGNNVVIHCRQGVGRSGMIAAAVLVAGGIGIEEGLHRLAASRGLDVPETAEQLAWVRHKAQVLSHPAAQQA